MNRTVDITYANTFNDQTETITTSILSEDVQPVLTFVKNEEYNLAGGYIEKIVAKRGNKVLYELKPKCECGNMFRLCHPEA